MKRVIAILSMSVLMFGLAACQQTPENPLIVGKDIDNMIDKAAENPVATDSGNDLRALLEAPERLLLDAKGQKGNLSIHIDADVIVPHTASMPVARVTKGQFSEEDVKNLYNALIGAGKSISPDSSPQSAYYLQKVQEFREMKKNGDRNDKYMSEEEIDRAIQELMEQAASAPDSYKYIEPDFSFKENKDTSAGPLGPYARLYFTPDDNMISEIYIVQDLYGMGAYAEYVRDKYSVDPTEPVQLTTSQEDAERLALDTIAQLGLSDFVRTGERESSESINATSGFHPGSGLYEFMFTRAINNAPITYTDDDGLTTVHEAYFKPWMYEKIRIFIDDDGVCYLKWNSPYEVKEIVSEASSMLPFSDIQDVLVKMLPIKYDYMDTDEFYSNKMNITEIRLGLMRITEKNVGDSGLLIPVWDVFGTLTLTGQPGKPNPEEGEQSYAYTSFITINAIDGSIIDRELGY
jgi:hypothetical protein